MHEYKPAEPAVTCFVPCTTYPEADYARELSGMIGGQKVYPSLTLRPTLARD